MDPAPYYWGVVGGLLYEAGRFGALFLSLAAGFGDKPRVMSGLAALILGWGMVCCVSVGRWSARSQVRTRWVVVVANGVGFAMIVSVPGSGAWYSGRWVADVLTTSALTTVLVAAGYLTRRPKWRLEPTDGRAMS